MGILNKLFSKSGKEPIKVDIIAPIKGKVVSLEKVQDETFATKLLGDGVAIEPVESGVIVSPIDGIIDITPTLHAFTVESKDGINVLVHLGLDTVKLNGQGFEQLVKAGSKVKAGEAIVKYNYEYLKENAPSIITPVIVLDSDEYKEIVKFENQDVNAGEEKILEIIK